MSDNMAILQMSSQSMNYHAQSGSRKQLKYLDLYRVIAMLLVMYGHFVDEGSYAHDIPNVIMGTMEETILNSKNFFLLKPSVFLYNRFNVQSACLGVVMFFISTGYLVAGMMERYTRREFLVNRLLRIFPCMTACVVFNGFLLSILQGFHFPLSVYLTSITASFPWFRTEAIMGVLWTMVIELLFYMVAIIIHQFNSSRIASTYIIILLLGALRLEFPQIWWLQLLTYYAEYISFCLQGALLWTLERSKHSCRCLLLLSLSANIVIFKLYQMFFGDITTYPHVFTHFIPLMLFLLLRWSEKKIPIVYQHTKIISWISSLVFSEYLTHVIVGINVMYFLREIVSSRTLLVLVAIVSSFSVAWLLTVLVEKPSIKFCRIIITRMRKSDATAG